MVPFVTLIILDGWGVALPSPRNAISQAQTPHLKSYFASYPHTTLNASGEAVGLPRGEVGNTETGHLNIGAGKIIYQDLLRINMAISDNSFFENNVFMQAIEHTKKNKSKLHLLGLLGQGGVHASSEHLFALIKLCKDNNFEDVFIHLITDGRDSPPTSALNYLDQLNSVIKKYSVGTIASVMGRYWAMDRDGHWERTEKAYKALTSGEGKFVENINQAIEESYANQVTDEFINPLIVTRDGKPISIIQENDAVIFFNFRIDRPRQLTRAFVFENLKKEVEEDQEFDPYIIKHLGSHLKKRPLGQVFERGQKLKNLFFVTMTQYSRAIAKYAECAFPPVVVNLPLSGVIEAYEKRQLKLAESEKERFVTYYLNGQRDIQYTGEDRTIIPSQAVATYDLKPEMSAPQITDSFLKALGENNPGHYSLFVINFANADMVGHTGNLQATIKACEVLDECLGKIVNQVLKLKGAVVITADHGNAEEMVNNQGKVSTEHSSNPVPLIVISKDLANRDEVLQSGILADVAPTVLKLLGIDKPSDMTGRSLI